MEAIMMRLTAVVLAASIVSALPAAAQQQEKHSDAGMTVTHGRLLTWSPLDVPGFLPGLKVAVLAGDPEKAAPYTLRLQFPAGYRFPGHSHPNVENLTVVSGKFLLGMGDKTDIRQLKTYEPGDYLMIAPNMAHFGGSDVETVIQLHGIGPFAINVTEQLPGAKAAN
jgi:quercetin dioxygenase-like cupin family protein